MTDVLCSLKTAQKREALALGVAWSENHVVAVRQDGKPLRPESYTYEFRRLRARAWLSRIKLHSLPNTSVYLMVDKGIPVHIVVAWHGHDPAVGVDLRRHQACRTTAAGASLFGWPVVRPH